MSRESLILDRAGRTLCQPVRVIPACVSTIASCHNIFTHPPSDAATDQVPPSLTSSRLCCRCPRVFLTIPPRAELHIRAKATDDYFKTNATRQLLIA
jgi:hypothetical protein